MPVPPVAESVIEPFELPLHNGFTTCVFVHANKVGEVIDAVIVFVQPMLLLMVTVYVFGGKLVNVYGDVVPIIPEGFNEIVIGTLADPVAVMLPFAKPLQVVLVLVRLNTGNGSTEIFIVESTKGQPG